MSKVNDEQKKRLAKHGFQPGQPSANPGGRPKMDPDLKAAFRGHGPEALETLVATLRKPDARDADKIRAAEVILNRGYGMPTQQVEVDINQTLSITSALEQMRSLAQRDEPPVIEAQVVPEVETKPKD